MLAEGLLICKLFSAQAVLWPSSNFSCFFVPWFFPFPPSLGTYLPAGQPLCALQLGQVLHHCGRTSTLTNWNVCKLTKKPAGRLPNSRSVRRRVGLSYVDVLVLSHFSCEHRFLPLALAKQTAALRAVPCGKRGLRC